MIVNNLWQWLKSVMAVVHFVIEYILYVCMYVVKIAQDNLETGRVATPFAPSDFSSRYLGNSAGHYHIRVLFAVKNGRTMYVSFSSLDTRMGPRYVCNFPFG